MLKPLKLTAIGIAVVASLTACNRDYTNDREGGPKAEVGSLAPAAVATALLRPTQGNEARGTVNFASTADGVRVTVDVTGLDPGQHEIFVQENGDCTTTGGNDAAAAKPQNAASTVEADSSGKAHSEFVDNRLALEGHTSIVGRAVVIEEAGGDAEAAIEPGEDTDTDVACGVIVATRP